MTDLPFHACSSEPVTPIRILPPSSGRLCGRTGVGATFGNLNLFSPSLWGAVPASPLWGLHEGLLLGMLRALEIKHLC